jgi:hypothetical protein
MKEVYSAPDMEVELFDTVVMGLLSENGGTKDYEDDLEG